MAATESDTGFSHIMAFPPLDAAWICSAWKAVGEPMSTAFADTAKYLYEQIAPWVKQEYGIESALVTGAGGNRGVLLKHFANPFEGAQR